MVQSPYSNLKMLRHLDRIESFLAGKGKPVMLSIYPTASCNHKCPHCCIQYKQDITPYHAWNYDDTIKDFLLACRNIGVKALKVSGGEPTLHPDFSALMAFLIDNFEVGLVTNGSKFGNPGMLDAVNGLSWIRLSIDAGSLNEYHRVHGCKDPDAFKVFEQVVSALRKHSPQTLIGFSFVITNQNYSDIVPAANLANNMGFHYIRFTGHLSPGGLMIRPELMPEVMAKLSVAEEVGTDSFSVYPFRERQIQTRERAAVCYYSMLASTINADGTVSLCCDMRSISRAQIGNMYYDTPYTIFSGRQPVKVKGFCDPCWMDSKNLLVENIYTHLLHENFP